MSTTTDRIAIIADDLTGASDAGVQFVRKGLRAVVLFDGRQLAPDVARVDTIAIDTDSRSMAPDGARRRVEETARALHANGVTHFYKKVDSTLRGNLGAEVDGVMNAVDFDLAVVAPAFPRLGRTTVGGRHYLGGVDLMETEIMRDPKAPPTSDLVELLSRQSSRKAGLIPRDIVAAGADAIANAVAALLEAGVKLVVFDAAEDAELERIATTMAGGARRVLWVGSAGLADYLPGPLGLKSQGTAAWAIPVTGKPVMLVAGSRSEMTRSQVEVASAAPGVVAVELDPLEILRGHDAFRTRRTGHLQALSQAVAAGHDLVLTVGAAAGQVDAARALGATLGLDPTAVSNHIAELLGGMAAELIRTSALTGVIMTGGDTAKAICRHLDVNGLELLLELETGVPVSRFLGGPALLAVTKAGAFGTKQTLARAMNALKGGTIA